MRNSGEKERRHAGRGSLLATPAVLWLLLFLVAPLVIVLVVSLATRGPYGKTIYDLTAANYLRAFDSLYLQAYWRTIWIATVTTVITAVVSFPVAYYIALRARPRWKRVLLVLTVIPFWTSFLIRTYAWILLLRSEGVVNSALMGAVKSAVNSTFSRRTVLNPGSVKVTV